MRFLVEQDESIDHWQLHYGHRHRNFSFQSNNTVKRLQRIAAASRDQDTIRIRPGWAEQDPKDWWKMITSAIREALRKSGIDPREIAVVVVTAQMHGLSLCTRTAIP